MDLKRGFDIVKHDILFDKLNDCKLTNIIPLFQSFLLNRKQRVLYKNQISDYINLGDRSIIQGSVSGPILFQIFINDIFKLLYKCKVIAFADDLTIIFSDKSIDKLNDNINNCLLKLYNYFNNQIILNTSKTSYILIGTNDKSLNIFYNNYQVLLKNELKILGVIFDSKLSFKYHINNINNKLIKYQNIFKIIRHYVPLFALNTLYNAMILPTIRYGSVLWCFTYDKHIKHLNNSQKNLAKIVTFSDPLDNSQQSLNLLKWLQFKDLWTKEIITYIYKNINGYGSTQQFFSYQTNRNTRSKTNKSLKLSTPKYNYTKNTIFFKGIQTWNSFDYKIREESDFKSFKSHIKDYIIT